MGRSSEDGLVALRVKAERALRLGRTSGEAFTLLERLLQSAPAGSEEAVFAHRHLAEMQLEKSPWRSALHLRQVLRTNPDDEVAHALRGLCHALLGHFGVAVAAYRRALRIAPDNPWYNHNLGHLLDAALRRPADGLPLLRRAHQLEPEEDEICASLGHCLAALGQLAEADDLVCRAVRLNPVSAEHRELAVWLKAGAPAALEPLRPAVAGRSPDAEPQVDPVERLLVNAMSEAAFRVDAIAQARAIWRAYARTRKRKGRAGNPAVYAAAVELAFVRGAGSSPGSLSSLASRYGVGPRAVEKRADDIATTLQGLGP